MENGVVHIGAHRGEELQKYIDLGADSIVWIEANPDVFLELQENIAKSPPEVTNILLNALCTDKDHEPTKFYIIEGPDAGYQVGNKGCSSILVPNGRFIPWMKKEIVMDSITVDTLFEENNLNFSDYSLMSMDVQGAELLVLKGAEKLLQNIHEINIEVTWANPDYHDNVMMPEIEDYLLLKGFELRGINAMTGDWGDALFTRASL